jgi:hypothetical protein
MGAIATSGYIAELNGFISGISVSLPQDIPAGRGLHWQVYRDAMPTPCHFHITDQDVFTNPDSTAGGTKRSRIFNITPSAIIQGESEQQTFHFKAGERIALVKKTMDLYGYTDADINYAQVQIHRVYDIINDETLNALGIGGGNIGGLPGGGGTDPEDPIEEGHTG